MNEEFRQEAIEAIVDGMISEMTLEDMRRYVWDDLYEKLVFEEDFELQGYIEKYAPEFATHG